MPSQTKKKSVNWIIQNLAEFGWKKVKKKCIFMMTKIKCSIIIIVIKFYLFLTIQKSQIILKLLGSDMFMQHWIWTEILQYLGKYSMYNNNISLILFAKLDLREYFYKGQYSDVSFSFEFKLKYFGDVKTFNIFPSFSTGHIKLIDSHWHEIRQPAASIANTFFVKIYAK